jgi:hypothetical protein
VHVLDISRNIMVHVLGIDIPQYYGQVLDKSHNIIVQVQNTSCNIMVQVLNIPPNYGTRF